VHIILVIIFISVIDINDGINFGGKLNGAIKWGVYAILYRDCTVTWRKRRCGSPALITLTMFDLCNNIKYYLYDYC
jgi:hypothetical protein